jgi:protein gp37
MLESRRSSGVNPTERIHFRLFALVNQAVSIQNATAIQINRAPRQAGFRLTLQPHMIELPLRWKKPQTIFVNSMSDLFHEQIPLEYIQHVFEIMRRAHWHRFQVLTKRAGRLADVDRKLEWAPNIWMGVSVESDEYRSRIDDLRSTRARLKFLSLEPLLGPLFKLNLQGISWVIVGGESGPKARAMKPAWATDLRDQCRRAKVVFFFKQWGGKNKEQAGRILDGRTWNQMPNGAEIVTRRLRHHVSLAAIS